MDGASALVHAGRHHSAGSVFWCTFPGPGLETSAAVLVTELPPAPGGFVMRRMLSAPERPAGRRNGGAGEIIGVAFADLQVKAEREGGWSVAEQLLRLKARLHQMGLRFGRGEGNDRRCRTWLYFRQTWRARRLAFYWSTHPVPRYFESWAPGVPTLKLQDTGRKEQRRSTGAAPWLHHHHKLAGLPTITPEDRLAPHAAHRPLRVQPRRRGMLPR